MKPSAIPWADWFAFGVGFLGLSPWAFWRLSLAEWHWLYANQDSRPDEFQRTTLIHLMNSFPDGKDG